jgi:hypothetical protein
MKKSVKKLLYNFKMLSNNFLNGGGLMYCVVIYLGIMGLLWYIHPDFLFLDSDSEEISPPLFGVDEYPSMLSVVAIIIAIMVYYVYVLMSYPKKSRK